MIRYVVGDATAPGEPSTIAHICNNKGGWGAGFVLAVSRRWPEPEAAYRSLRHLELGHTQLVRVAGGHVVANMVAQDGFPSRERPCAVDYAALEECLSTVAKNAPGMPVVCPRIGCGIAGGSWPVVEAIILRAMPGVDVTVYDFLERK